MKKVLAFFLIGAILIGIGIGVTFFEISEFEFIDTNPILVNQETQMVEYDFDYDSATQTVIYVDRYSNNYERISYKVVEENMLDNDIRIEVYYKGNEPRVSFRMWDTIFDENDNVEYQEGRMFIYDSNVSFKYIKDIVSYAFENKVLFEGYDHEIEEVIIKVKDKSNLTLIAD